MLAAMDAPLLLLVDDDHRLRELSARYLESQGFRVAPVAHLAGMRRELERRHVDLIVLDLMLPDGDGLTACRDLRAAGCATPVIMLTARGEDVDRIIGLELGADDYLPKPCNPRELLARIRAVLRRQPPLAGAAPQAAAEVVRFGRCALELHSRVLVRAGERLVLSSGEFAVLAALVRHPHQPLSRDRLMNLARGLDHQASDRSIDVMLSRLRKLVEDDPRRPRWLQTVRQLGYVFVPEPPAS
jgi:two-component system phosphate regulon response regulator OmpR